LHDKNHPTKTAATQQSKVTLATREIAVDSTRAARLPRLALSSTIGVVSYPQTLSPFSVDPNTNWSVIVTADVPIFEGNRKVLGIRAAQWSAEAARFDLLDAERIADREGCTTRQVNMTISLAFLAPDLVKAAIQGQLPHGMGVRRLRDMPSEWQRQRQTLGPQGPKQSRQPIPA